MNKLIVRTVVLVVVLTGAIGGYRYFARTQAAQVQTPLAVPAAPEAKEHARPRVIPHQDSFKDRFQPTFPTPNGGSASQR